MRDLSGVHIPAALVPPSQPQIAALRLLGRLEFATSAQLQQLAFPNASRQEVHRQLTKLRKEELIWRVPVSFGTLPEPTAPETPTMPLRLPFVYGLTAVGRQILELLEVETDQRSLQALKAREPGSRPPSALTLTHDLQASWWCGALLSALRQNGYVRSIFLQTEFIVHERQRMDALVIIRVTRTPQPIDPARWPWFDGTPRRPDEIDIRLALEIDRGTESLPVLLGKGATYRDLHAQGTYNQAFGGPVLPVFLAPTPRRVAQIAREWRDIWPQGWGVISTPRSAAFPHGVLWGDYRTLTEAQPFPLLSIADPHPVTNAVRWTPLCTPESWAAQDAIHEQKA